MNKTKKIIVRLVALGAVAAIGYGMYIYNKPARDVKDEKAIQVTAGDLFETYNKNENEANTKYLNKAIEVTGVVADAKENQAGQTVVILQTSDPVFGVNCTFKEKPRTIEKGNTITFKGICTGFLSDVIINEGILIEKK